VRKFKEFQISDCSRTPSQISIVSLIPVIVRFPTTLQILDQMTQFSHWTALCIALLCWSCYSYRLSCSCDSKHVLAGRGQRKMESWNTGGVKSAHLEAHQIMMASMMSITEQTIARIHIFFRDFCCDKEIRDSRVTGRDFAYWQHLKWPMEAHLVVGGSLELLWSSFYVDLSILHICLNAICRAEHTARSSGS